jgi:hypothetical protein
MPTRPSFPDPPSRPGMVGLGLVIPLPQEAKHITSGDEPLPQASAQMQEQRNGLVIRGPEERARSLQTRVPTSTMLTLRSSYIKILRETATTSCKVPLSPLPFPSSLSTPHASQAAIVTAAGQAPKPLPSSRRPKLKRSVACLSETTCFPPDRRSRRAAAPAIPLANCSKARGPSRTKTKKVFVSSGRASRRYSRHVQLYRGAGSSAGPQRNSNSSTESSNALSISTLSSCTNQVATTSLPIAASRLVRRPRVSPAGSTRPTPAPSVGAISVASWLEFDDDIALPEDIVCSSPEPVDPVFLTIVEGDWEDDVARPPSRQLT